MRIRLFLRIAKRVTGQVMNINIRLSDHEKTIVLFVQIQDKKELKSNAGYGTISPS